MRSMTSELGFICNNNIVFACCLVLNQCFLSVYQGRAGNRGDLGQQGAQGPPVCMPL